jgi:hypothetical protein
MSHKMSKPKPKPKFSVGQIVTRTENQESVSILQVKWAGHCYYVLVLGLDGKTIWLLESQLSAPIGMTA